MSDSTATVVKHLDATDTTYRRRQREADSTAGVRRAERRAAEQVARAQHVLAEREAALAAAALTARDSAEHWRLAYLGERARADSLAAALVHETAGGLAILRARAEVQDRVREQEAAIAGLRRDLRERTAQLAVAKKNTERNLLAGIALGVVADRLVPALLARR